MNRWWASMGVPAAVLLAGCGVFPQPVELREDGVTAVSVRVLHRLGGGPGGLEAEYTGLRAEGRQFVGSFSDVTLAGRTITGPAQLDHRVNMHHAHLVYNRRLFTGSPVQMEWFAGAAAHRLAWSTSTPGQPGLQAIRNWGGATGGVTGVLVFSPALELQLRYSGAVSVERVTASRDAVELALAWAPVPPLQLRLGFAQNTSYYELNNGDSDLRLRTRGPYLGLQVGF